MIQVGTKVRILQDRPQSAQLKKGDVVTVTHVFKDEISVDGSWALNLDKLGILFEIVEPSPSGDAINHPAHYNQGKIEVIEFIEDKKLGFHLGNAVKYISRAGKKDPAKEIEDLKKAVWYLERHIELISGGTRRPNEMKK